MDGKVGVGSLEEYVMNLQFDHSSFSITTDFNGTCSTRSCSTVEGGGLSRSDLEPHLRCNIKPTNSTIYKNHSCTYK